MREYWREFEGRAQGLHLELACRGDTWTDYRLAEASKDLLRVWSDRSRSFVAVGLLLYDQPRDHFDSLLRQRESLEESFQALVWDSSRLCNRDPYAWVGLCHDCDPGDPSDRQAQHTWLLANLQRFYSVIKPRWDGLPGR